VSIINPAQAHALYKRLPKRSKYILAISLETGLRVGDILKLRYIDIENPLRVYVKRLQRTAAYPLSEWLYDELRSFDYISPNNYIFSSRRKRRKPIHRTTYHRDIKKAVDGLFKCSSMSARRLYLADTGAAQKLFTIGE
jgi:integrase